MSTADPIDDPFSDRKQGPRTRSRAIQEEKELRTPKAIKTDIPRLVSPSSPQFAETCSPSLDEPNVAENERTRVGREAEKAAEEEINPFFENKGFYFGEVGSSKERTLPCLTQNRI